LLELNNKLETIQYADDNRFEDGRNLLETLSKVHSQFYRLHEAIFDRVNWTRHGKLYNPNLYANPAPTRPVPMAPEQLDLVLSKLGL
jgi:hypothetical protein